MARHGEADAAGAVIYLDYQATTPLAPEALAAMLPWLTDQHANPHSPHRPGRAAKAAVEVARAQVAALLPPGTVVRTVPDDPADDLVDAASQIHKQLANLNEPASSRDLALGKAVLERAVVERLADELGAVTAGSTPALGALLDHLARRDEMFALASWWLKMHGGADLPRPDIDLLRDWRGELVGRDLLRLLEGELGNPRRRLLRDDLQALDDARHHLVLEAGVEVFGVLADDHDVDPREAARHARKVDDRTQI